MEPITEKRQALKAAQELLSRNDDELLRYAALELRRCLEAVVYEKLWAYRDRVPADVAHTWQPPQAFRALLLMEPDAEDTSTICVAPEKQPGVPPAGPYRTLGVDHRPRSGWLNKTYNKLGALLHAQWPFARHSKRADPKDVRAYLQRVGSELEPFVHRSLTVTLATVIDFQCSVCGTTVRANALGIDRAGEVTCLNPGCGSRFFAVREDDDFTFHLDASTAACPDCKQEIALPAQKLVFGYQFSCAACGCEFKVVDQIWQFQKVNEDSVRVESRSEG